MKLSFVTPRYGEDIVGGAEYAVRTLAENCIKYGGVEAEVLTTTAGDERTWSSKYDSGVSEINGVTVKRFSNELIVRDKFDAWAQPLLSAPDKVSTEKFDEWLTRQGPYSPGLLEEISGSKSDALIFHPMLSSPASHGILEAKIPTVLHPALHDEPLVRMPGYSKVLNSASLLAFSTRFEQDLAMELHGTHNSKQSVIGFGIDQPQQYSQEDIDSVLAKYDVKQKSYMIVIGRVDPGKGADLIAKYWGYAKDFLSEIETLVFVGPISDNAYVKTLNKHRLDQEQIVLTDAITDKEKNIMLSQANVLVTPSVTESFSLVVLEAMQEGVPVIVNRYCGPTYEHVQRSNSGASFDSVQSFISVTNTLSKDGTIREISIENGKNYVSGNYDWEVLIEKYLGVLNTIF